MICAQSCILTPNILKEAIEEQRLMQYRMAESQNEPFIMTTNFQSKNKNEGSVTQDDITI